MTVPFLTNRIPNPQKCICGHGLDVHADAKACGTNHCECKLYSELCPQCDHGKYSHTASDKRCARRITRPQHENYGKPCGCDFYVDGTDTDMEPPMTVEQVEQLQEWLQALQDAGEPVVVERTMDQT